MRSSWTTPDCSSPPLQEQWSGFQLYIVYPLFLQYISRTNIRRDTTTCNSESISHSSLASHAFHASVYSKPEMTAALKLHYHNHRKFKLWVPAEPHHWVHGRVTVGTPCLCISFLVQLILYIIFEPEQPAPYVHCPCIFQFRVVCARCLNFAGQSRSSHCIIGNNQL